MRAPALALAGLVLAAPSAVAAPGTLSGKVTDGKLPKPTAGRSVVEAISVADGRIVAGTNVGSGGAWKLSVEPGWYVPTAYVVQTGKKVVSAIAPLQRVRAGRVTRTAVSLKRTKTPKAKRVRRGARAAATLSAPVGIKRFSATGPNSQLGLGLATMLVSDMTNTSSGDCEPLVIEVMRRQEILDELALANSNRVDPRSRIPTGHLIDPAFYIQGTVATTATSTSWTLELVDARTGEAVGGDSGTANGADIFGATAGIAQRLTDQLCGSEYKVSVNIQATIGIPPYSGFGTMTAEVPVKDVSGTMPPTRWLGQALVVFGGLSYGGIPGCDVIPGPHDGYVKVEIKKASAPGMIEVTWGGETFDFTTLICPGAPPILNGALPIMPLLGTQPGLLIFPAAGGTQPVAGGVGTAGGAWSNSGTVTVTRVPKGT